MTENTAPPSYGQRAMWAIAQRYRDAPLNVMILPWRIEGDLDIRALSGAVSDLLVRHSALRTRLDMVDGKLCQVIERPQPIHIESRSVVGSDDDERRRTAACILAETGRIALDLRARPAVAVELLRISGTEHVFCLFIHHALCDGWSSQIIQQEITELYAARTAGRASSLLEEPPQFAAFAEEQMRRYEQGLFEQDLAYWRRELADTPPKIPLPIFVARSIGRDMTAESPTHVASREFVSEVKAAARRYRVSPFSLLLSALSILVYSRTSATDFLVGVSTSNRWSQESSRVVGLISNMLPARVRLQPDLIVEQLLAEVHATVKRLIVYGRVPFELIVKDVYGPIAAAPAMQLWCQYRQLASPTESIENTIRFVPMLIDRAAILCNLEVDFVESGRGLETIFAHRRSLFIPDVIGDWMEAFDSIVPNLLLHPELTVQQVLM